MYIHIYQLPFDVKQELCRLLDIEDNWKELALHMKYSDFEVEEIELIARRRTISPTNQLFIQWGQFNHTVDELFTLLYSMKHIPGLNCVGPIVYKDFHKRFHKFLERCCTAVVQDEKLHETGEPATSTGKSSTNDVGEAMQKMSAIPVMSYEELRDATNNWSESNLLGSGGFGNVFKGKWKHLPVAVKRLNPDGRNKELIAEMCLNQYRHDNILSLYGCSLDGPEACLVYQLMAGGSLAQRLKGYPPLDWSQRYNIAHGVARGLQFLHTMAKTPLIHGDIKPGNILLDQNLMPRIGDFGLARKGPYEDKTDFEVSRLCGTPPYLPREYVKTHCISPAVDVFSYGVVMAEMATALPAYKKQGEFYLRSYIQQIGRSGTDPASLEDPALRGSVYSNPAMCREFFAIAIHCTKYEKNERPTMLQVFMRLDALQPSENYLPFTP